MGGPCSIPPLEDVDFTPKRQRGYISENSRVVNCLIGAVVSRRDMLMSEIEM
jgi:hypothetical protein